MANAALQTQPYILIAASIAVNRFEKLAADEKELLSGLEAFNEKSIERLNNELGETFFRTPCLVWESTPSGYEILLSIDAESWIDHDFRTWIAERLTAYSEEIEDLKGRVKITGVR